jgi:hypothetical protein
MTTRVGSPAVWESITWTEEEEGMAELIVTREHFGFVYNTILPKVSIQVSDLPKTSGIDYIVDDENRHKVRYQNKYGPLRN